MSTLVLRTSIRPQTVKSAIFKGIAVAILGLGCTWLAEYLLPFLGIDSLGAWAWALRGAAAGTGFIPYQKIIKQKTSPDLLKINDQKIIFCKSDVPLFVLPWDQIASFTFLDRGALYGLAFKLKKKDESSDPHLAELMKTLQNESEEEISKEVIEKNQNFGADIFLPYFTERTHLMLQQWHNQTLGEERVISSPRA